MRRYPLLKMIRAVEWTSGKLRLLDQRVLPLEEVWIEATTWQQVAEAISSMAVRGAPIIGVAAAYGLVLAEQSNADLQAAFNGLSNTRPTAVNLFHALNRVMNSLNFLQEAQLIENEEIESNRKIGELGASLISQPARVLTICNTGSLATPGIGTALGIIRTLHQNGHLIEAILCETRPRQQGLKLSAWELEKDNIPFRVIVEGAMAHFVSHFQTDLAIAGADRIAKNGDSANKIGTHTLAIICNRFEIPFAIAAPTSTIDTTIESGKQIPIEERNSEEVTTVSQIQIAPKDFNVWNPAFDVTPAQLIKYIITEKGVHQSPYNFA